MPGGDETLTYLLDLDGEEIIYDGGFIARFKVKRIAATPEKPHGVSYSLTFHAADGRRLMGYDNAHGDWHRDETDEGRPYRFVSAEKLIADFFDEIARTLEERNHD